MILTHLQHWSTANFPGPICRAYASSYAGRSSVHYEHSVSSVLASFLDGMSTKMLSCWPLIVLLTGVLAYSCMKASTKVYNRSTQLPWLPFTIPCFGIAVGLWVWISCLWQARDVRPLPLFEERGQEATPHV